MKKTYLNKISFIAALILLTTASCKKFLTPNPEAGAVQSTDVFTTNGTATSAILGMYTSMMEGGLGSTAYNGSLGVFLGLASDELNDYTQSYVDWQNNQPIYSNYSPDYYVWSVPYNVIYQANTAIEGLTAASGLSDSIRTQLLGESYFIRAFSYFLLTNVYGAVPLAVTSNYSTNATLARTDTATVYQQIVSDLHQAETLLTATYPSSNMVRANRYVAQALLARVYLYQQNYAQAEAMVDSVLAGPYQLAGSLGAVFKTTSPEVIWEELPVSEGYNNAYDYSWYTPASNTSGPLKYLTPSLVSSFETGDQRATTWITAYPFSGTTYYYPSKYTATPASSTTQYNVVLRLAEQYLIRAEARAWENNLSGAAADLNLVRARAGLPATTATTEAMLLTAIAHERRVELFTEWGNRWFDLKRTGTIDAVLGSLKSGWTDDDRLIPLPQLELAADPNLTQNPGY